MKRPFLFILFLYLSSIAFAQNALVRSGPMLGYSSMKEVGIWIQLEKEADVKVRYWPATNEKEKKETAMVKSQSENSFICHLIAVVNPGVKYNYAIIVNKKEIAFDYPLEFQSQSLWQHRSDPPDVKFALGSCVYINEPEVDRPGKAYGGNYEVFSSINNENPDFMLWMGDNAYLREVDWNSKTGIYHRYSHSRDVSEMQALLARSHHFAIWDDHDYGPNNSDKSFWNKKITEKAFKDFWMNPNYNLTGNGGITGTFFWNDCQFFMLDNRYFRTANGRKTGDKEILGNAQIDWLINALKSSPARFKFIVIGGQFISNAAVHENHINLAPEERQEIINLISEENIKGVIFLSGDRHHSELSKLDRKDQYPIYDWTVSPLTATAYEIEDEGNTLLIPGSSFGERCFGTIEVTGAYKERLLKLKLFNKDGEELWNFEIKAEDLN
ncbi:alkaline phosphatase family protein [Hyphobacterium sp. CCMP332]|nr:alkaline phosphatase family protein [Hyphobacterium sp. CCMP332]